MSYELSDKIILKGELMKYRRSLCEQVSEYGGLCKKCRVSNNGQCAIGIVIKSLEGSYPGMEQEANDGT